MAFEHQETQKVTPSSTDEMVALGHLAATGPKPGTRKFKKQPIPRESRRACHR